MHALRDQVLLGPKKKLLPFHTIFDDQNKKVDANFLALYVALNFNACFLRPVL